MPTKRPVSLTGDTLVSLCSIAFCILKRLILQALRLDYGQSNLQIWETPGGVARMTSHKIPECNMFIATLV